MNEYRFKRYVGLFIIVMHIFIISTLFLCFSQGGFSFDQFTTIVGIIFPMFAGYSSAVVGYFIRIRHEEKINYTSKLVDPGLVFLAFFLPGCFGILIVICIVGQSFGKIFSDFEQFKKGIFGAETIFALYCGAILYSLFDKTDLLKSGDEGD